jgi:antitoxin CptB
LALREIKVVSGKAISSEGLDERRRKLLFRAWHRGARELDLILGRFADAHIARLNERDLADFERLLEVPDPEIYRWVMGAAAVPPEFECPVFRQLRDFHFGTSEAAGGAC